MNRFAQNACLFAVLLFCLLFNSAIDAQTQTLETKSIRQTSYTEGTIGAEQAWATKWYCVDSGVAGPTVLVTAGVHGNEPAGWRAAQQIRHWPIITGRLVVVPRVNTIGLDANTRWIPEHRNNKSLRDLNRNFPKADRLEPQTQLASAVWDYVKALKPDYVFDLHEGFAVHRENSKSVGSSIITFPDQSNIDIAKAMHSAVNATIKDQQKHFTMLAGSGPVVGSLARASQEQLSATAFILETTSTDQPLSRRTRQHRVMMQAALRTLGLISPKSVANDLVAPTGVDWTVVGLFDGPGTAASRENIARIIDQQTDGFVAYLGPEDIRPEILNQFDVIIFPGGSGSQQAKALGETRRQYIRDYIGDGGGYVGICAGAYLCSAHYDWSLHVINTRVYNTMVDVPGVGRKSMWYRGGPTDVKVEFNSEGESLLKIKGTHSVRYQNGPIVSQAENHHLGYNVLASFRSENYQYAVQKGTMVDTPAIVYATYGSGKVFSISPHFESTKNTQSVIWSIIEQAR